MMQALISSDLGSLVRTTPARWVATCDLGGEHLHFTGTLDDAFDAAIDHFDCDGDQIDIQPDTEIS